MKRIRFAQVLAAAGFLLTASAQAEDLGVSIGLTLWQQGYDGDVRAGGGRIDLEDDLGFNDDTDASYFIQWEHALPLVPNFKLQHTEVYVSNFGFVEGVEFGGVDLTGDVSASLNLGHTDLTLYYEVLDSWVNLDVGLTARRFDDRFVQVINISPTSAGSVRIDEVIPALYGHARFDLPLTGLSAGIEANATNFNDNTLFDARLNFGYCFDFGLGIEAGYRLMDYEYDDGDELLDVTIDGFYGGVSWDF